MKTDNTMQKKFMYTGGALMKLLMNALRDANGALKHIIFLKIYCSKIV